MGSLFSLSQGSKTPPILTFFFRQETREKHEQTILFPTISGCVRGFSPQAGLQEEGTSRGLAVPGHTQNMMETSNGPRSPKCPRTTSNLCKGLLHIQEKMSRWKQMSAPKKTGLHDFLADFEVKTCYVNSFSSLISYHFIKYHLKLGYCLKHILLEDLI